jgi:hypothetical protein
MTAVRVQVLSLLAVIAFVFLWNATRSSQAQQPSAKTVGSGFQVEEVRVGSSCVVVISRDGPGEPAVAAVPCR